MAGVSGGADSVCLLLILSELMPQIGYSLYALHVEHGIRGEESRADAEFTEQLCRKLGVPFMLCHVDVPRCREETGLSPEEAAREVRYDCYRKACAETGADRVALAHHADDCAETMLFNLARGTGIRGMSGIRPVSQRTRFIESDVPSGEADDARRADNIAGGFTVIRPLLCLTRAQIEDWLAGRGQEYRTDSTNTDVTYARNRIRANVLPELTKINTQAVPHMWQLSGQLAQVSDYLDEAAREAGREAVSMGDDAVVIDCGSFCEMHPVLQSSLLMQLLGWAAGSRRDITSVHVEQLLGLMAAEVGTRLSLPGKVTAKKMYDTVELRRRDPDLSGTDAPAAHTEHSDGAQAWETDLIIPGETVLENGLRFSTEILEFTDFSQKIPPKSYTKWFDYDKINSAVRLRGRCPGDYFQTDADGGHKKLNRFFIDEKVPLALRDSICLLADGSHILWVVGYRISEAYKVTGETRRVLCVTVDAGPVEAHEGGHSGIYNNANKGEDTDG